jgi:hypothetical protein
MTPHQLRSLQVLRQLREQRAAVQKIAQRRECLRTEEQLTMARQRLHLQREQLARKTRQAYGALVEGMSAGDWQAAQWHLEGEVDRQLQLQHQADDASRTFDEQSQTYETLRTQHIARQRQCEAWDKLLEGHQRDEQCAAEQTEDADDALLTFADMEPR